MTYSPLLSIVSCQLSVVIVVEHTGSVLRDVDCCYQVVAKSARWPYNFYYAARSSDNAGFVHPLWRSAALSAPPRPDHPARSQHRGGLQLRADLPARAGPASARA